MKNIKRIVAIYWSATENTKKLVTFMGKYMADACHIPCETIDFTPACNREKKYSYTEEDFVIVGAPTYAGKLPNKILPDFQTKLEGDKTNAMALVTFGNRSFDNSLAELSSVLSQNGFQLKAAAAFSCKHAFSDQLAFGRPNENDYKEARDFIDKIIAKSTEEVEESDSILSKIPGDAAAAYYVPKGVDGQPAKFLKAKVQTDASLCKQCGLCAKICPMQSIDPEDCMTVHGICIKCHACISHCPMQAKYMDDQAFLSHVSMLETNFKDRKMNAFYL